MSIRNALVFGGESGHRDSEPVSYSGNVSASSYLPRKNAKGTRGGTYCMRFSSLTTDSYFTWYSAIPWEEFLVEFGVKKSGTFDNLSWFVRDPSNNRCLEINITPTGKVRHMLGGATYALSQGAGTEQSASADGVVSSSSWTFLSTHIRIAGGTNGFMRTWIDTLGSVALDDSGIDTQANSVTNIQQFYFVGERANYIDDVLVRPRCVLVDGVTGGTPTYGGSISGGGASAEVYAWQSGTTDSQSGSGDPSLPSGTYRLFLRAVSFGPEATSGGWTNDTSVTVAGLTGTLQVHAPAANFRLGLEPGGQLLGNQLYLERPALGGTGTDNTSGTLVGGATDRKDALATTTDGKMVEHTADNEVVSCSVAAIANPTEVSEVLSVVGYVRAASDGASPNSVHVRLLDNGTEMLGPKVVVASSQTVVQHAFDLDAAGGQWAVGTGAGGTDSMEPSYKTGTT